MDWNRSTNPPAEKEKRPVADRRGDLPHGRAALQGLDESAAGGHRLLPGPGAAVGGWGGALRHEGAGLDGGGFGRGGEGWEAKEWGSGLKRRAK